MHAEFYRPAEIAMPDRYARHYSDMARLLAHDYSAMQQVFISQPPAFDLVLDQLAEAEARLNAVGDAK